MTVVLAAIAVLGVSAAAPLMAAAAAPALAIAFWRNALGAAVIVPVAATSRRTEIAALSGRDWRTIGVAATALAVHFACWASALKLTSVASATALVCMQVGFVVLLEAARGTRPTRGVLAGMAVALVGVVTVTGVDVSLSTEALVGDLLALVGGLAAAVYTIAGGEVRRTVSTTTYTSICYSGCAVLLAVAAVVAGQPLVGHGVEAWVMIVGVTICAQLLGHSLFNHLLAVLSPTVVSLILLIEVPGAALLAGAFLGQVPPLPTYAGLALILAGLVLVLTSARAAARPAGPDPVGQA